jgi:ABC-type phosphonate transport system ATPase subunit
MRPSRLPPSSPGGWLFFGLPGLAPGFVNGSGGAVGLAIWRGERILLEGASGGGKSTMAALLTRRQKPESGLLAPERAGSQHARRQVA